MFFGNSSTRNILGDAICQARPPGAVEGVRNGVSANELHHVPIFHGFQQNPRMLQNTGRTDPQRRTMLARKPIRQPGETSAEETGRDSAREKGRAAESLRVGSTSGLEARPIGWRRESKFRKLQHPGLKQGRLCGPWRVSPPRQALREISNGRKQTSALRAAGQTRRQQAFRASRQYRAGSVDRLQLVALGGLMGASGTRSSGNCLFRRIGYRAREVWSRIRNKQGYWLHFARHAPLPSCKLSARLLRLDFDDVTHPGRCPSGPVAGSLPTPNVVPV